MVTVHSIKDQIKAMLYLASPYSNEEPTIQCFRFETAAMAVGMLMRLRKTPMVYSPIVHCHPVAASLELPGHVDFWWEHNKFMLDQATGMAVLKLDGWKESKGVQREIKYVIDKIKIEFLDWQELCEQYRQEKNAHGFV